MADKLELSGGRLANQRTGQLVAQSVTALTHSAVGGTANGTMVDCTATYSEAAVEENFKELATKVNQIIVALQAVGIIQ